MRSQRDLRENLIGPFAGIYGIDVEEYVVAMPRELLLNRSREGSTCDISAVADENCLRAHENGSNLESGRGTPALHWVSAREIESSFQMPNGAQSSTIWKQFDEVVLEDLFRRRFKRISSR